MCITNEPLGRLPAAAEVRIYPSLPRPKVTQLTVWAIVHPRAHGEGDFVSHCILDRQDRKSTAENSDRRSVQLAPAEKSRRVAVLRALLHAPAFQAMIAAAQGRDRT